MTIADFPAECLAVQCACGCRSDDVPPGGCPCPECQPGPGIVRHKSQVKNLSGTLVQVTCKEWCSVCRSNVTVRAVRTERGWFNTCDQGHEWTSFG